MLKSMQFILVSAVACSGFVSASVEARPNRASLGPGSHPMVKILDQLNLTEDQKKKIESLRKSQKDEAKKTREAQKSAHEALQSAMSDPAKTEEELKKLHDAVVEANLKMMNDRFNNLLATRALLTEDQKKKFAELHKNMPKKRKKRGKNK